MKTLIQKTAFKVIAGILCILFLAAALLSGLVTLLLAANGGYDPDADLSASRVAAQMEEDASRVLYEYFDPDDPEMPYHYTRTDDIFTGRDTNFRYTLVDNTTGETVLNTYENENAMQTYILEGTRAVAVTPDLTDETVEDTVFLYDGTYYTFYEKDGDEGFYPVQSGLQPTQKKVLTLSRKLADSGFYHDGAHYYFDGENFLEDYLVAEMDESYVDHSYTVYGYLLSGLPAHDAYSIVFETTSLLQGLRFLILGVFLGSGLLALVLLLLLGFGIGRVNGQEEPARSVLFLVPPDLSLLCCGIIFLSAFSAFELTFYSSWVYPLMANSLLALLAATVALYGLMNFIVHCKTHLLVEKSLIYRCFHGCRRFVLWLLRRLPLVWKVMVGYGALCVLELVLMGMLGCFNWYGGVALLLWLLWKLALGVLVLYVALCLRRLKLGAETIAAGDYNTKVDERHLVLDFQSAADTLNHIQDGMNAAVDSRMRSERMKTELITNMSHDLKTPLTSIVSYVDLLKQEPAGSPAAAEYLGVLERQSHRLKKLIEDLVEASKASTGNLNLQLEPLDFGTLLGQAMGEYAQRLEAAQLTPIAHIPEEPIWVRADGRRLWRVFDNLLGNAVKYAMPGTRVYLDVAAGDTVTATFRNVSRDPLDVGPEELMERFVRGDASRHTEGSGLGLSIAKSLTESMGGSFQIAIDGDLFKAIVTFPVLPPEAPTAEHE